MCASSDTRLWCRCGCSRGSWAARAGGACTRLASASEPVVWKRGLPRPWARRRAGRGMEGLACGAPAPHVARLHADAPRVRGERRASQSSDTQLGGRLIQEVRSMRSYVDPGRVK